MLRTGAVRLGVLGSVIALDVALFAIWAFFVATGFSGDIPKHGLEALWVPSLLLVIAVFVLGTLAYMPQSMAVMAVVDVAAAAAGSVSVAQVGSSSSFWHGPFIVFFAVPPALLLVGGVCALLELLKHGLTASVRDAVVESEVAGHGWRSARRSAAR